MILFGKSFEFFDLLSKFWEEVVFKSFDVKFRRIWGKVYHLQVFICENLGCEPAVVVLEIIKDVSQGVNKLPITLQSFLFRKLTFSFAVIEEEFGYILRHESFLRFFHLNLLVWLNILLLHFH